MDKAHKLDGAQIEAIVDRIVPLIAAPHDQWREKWEIEIHTHA